jgi:ATP-dependent Lhr-like helicase
MIVRGWLECVGPTRVRELALRLGLAPSTVAAALARLEGEGVAMQGRFTPGAGGDTAGANGDEWCERRLLARIHRLTLGRLRREIDPVSVADFMRFLFRWQHVLPTTRLHGRDGLATVIGQLHGLELAAPAWERSVLPARVAHFEPGLLDELCLSGVVAWGRFSPPADAESAEAPAEAARLRRVPRAVAAATVPPRRRTAPTRAAPLALALRSDLDLLRVTRPDPQSPRLSHAARDVATFLATEGASFTADIAAATGLLPTATEEALWELVARGIVTGDGFAGLRRLVAPEERPRPDTRLRALRGGRAPRRALPAGRWALLASKRELLEPSTRAEAAARQLLTRYGVVLRELLARETLMPSWRELLVVLRRLEARGEIRGGRFVSGLVGEQFALPEAIEALRATRRSEDPDVLLVAAADPLNLVGILTPGARLSPLSGQVIAFERGVPIDSGELGAVRHRLRDRSLAAPGA